ncbi:MAG: ABC transporter substrate-binding protein [Gammaproteobacteria bacterium]|nr:MAG: ABC transporter substrate-binding protein [Gammaproteobacteria bacterium]
MSKRRCCLISVFFATVASLGLYSQTNAQLETPEDVVRATAESILQSMADRKEYLAAHPAELYRLVNSIFLPRFDQNYAAYLVLGRHVRAASAEQRSRFTTALYDYILNRYAQGLLSFTSDRLQILPYRDAPGEDRATVRTFVILDNGRRIPVNYDLRLSDVGWRLYDIAIDGISYVRNLRSQLGAEIEKNGLDSVIARLEAYRVDPPNDPA